MFELAVVAHDSLCFIDWDETVREATTSLDLVATVPLVALVVLALLFGSAFDQSVPVAAIERAAGCRVPRFVSQSLIAAHRRDSKRKQDGRVDDAWYDRA